MTAMSGRFILVLNCGSSSIKFALFDADQASLSRQSAWRGKIDGVGSPQAVFDDGTTLEQVPLDAARPYHAALALLRQRISAWLAGRDIVAVAHRVVHGGSKYFEPVRMDAGVLADLRSYIPLAPLHQPFALDAIDMLLVALPGVPQVACFDTAFHHTLPLVEKMMPLPRAAWGFAATASMACRTPILR